MPASSTVICELDDIRVKKELRSVASRLVTIVDDVHFIFCQIDLSDKVLSG